MAGEVHTHGLVAGEDKPEARADKESRPEEGDGRVAEREQEIRDDIECHAGAYEVDEVSPVDEAAGHDAVDDEPCGDERVEPAGTADAEFLGIERDVVGHGPVGEPHEDKVRELRDSAREEEAVERKRGVGLLLLGGDLQCLHQYKADDAQDDGDCEDDVVTEGLVQEHARHGAGSESEVHADAKIADAFAAAARGERIDGHRVTCGRRNPEA